MNSYAARLILLIGLLLLVCFSDICMAEEAAVDYSNDLRAYAQAVAMAVAGEEETGLEAASLDSGSRVILFRTEGGTPDLSMFDPESVLIGGNGCHTAVLKDGAAASACVDWLNGQSGIVYAEQNLSVEACSDSAAGGYLSFGAEYMDFQGARRFLESRKPASVTVAVIDSGVCAHSMILEKMPVLGYDYIDLDDDPTNDGYGHGTHVAGIVADCTRDMPVMILPIRILSDEGKGGTANLVTAIDEAVEAGASVINISITILKLHSPAVEDAILRAHAAGATVVLAAGNNNTDTANICPAHITETGVIVVGSVGYSSAGVLTRSSFSNYGTSVDMSAFGSGIVSCSGIDGYITKTGTSMAAPHISAAAAVLHSLTGGMSPAAAEQTLRKMIHEHASTAPGYPVISDICPQSAGVHTDAIALPAGTTLQLKSAALPDALHYGVQWTSSDETVASADENGVLTCTAPGACLLRAESEGLQLHELLLTVTEADGLLTLPDGLAVIGEEAFAGGGAQTVLMPASVGEIADNAFGGQVTMIVPEGSAAASWAAENAAGYLIVESDSGDETGE